MHTNVQIIRLTRSSRGFTGPKYNSKVPHLAYFSTSPDISSPKLTTPIPKLNISDLCITLEEIKSCVHAKEYGSDPDIFCLAVELGKNDLIKELLETGADPSVYNDFGIKIASYKGNKELVELLLADHRVDQNNSVCKAIRLAAMEDHTDIVDLLLPRVGPKYFGYLTKWAAEYGKVDMFRILLNDPRTNLSDTDKKEIIHNAMRSYLETKGHTSGQLLWYTQTKPNIAILKMIFADGRFDINTDNGYILRMSAEHGHARVVDMVLSKFKNINLSGIDEALESASCQGHINIVKKILADPRSNPNPAYRRVYSYTQSNPNQPGLRTIGRLLRQDSRFDPSADNNALLIDAARNGYLDFVKKLVKIPSVINGPNITFAIEEAICWNRGEIVRLLLSRAKLTLYDINSILECALEYERNNIIELIQANDKFNNE